jgi:hypothetical protein
VDPTTISPNHFNGLPFFGFFLHRKQTRRVFLIQIKQKLHAIGIGGERLRAEWHELCKIFTTHNPVNRKKRGDF